MHSKQYIGLMAFGVMTSLSACATPAAQTTTTTAGSVPTCGAPPVEAAFRPVAPVGKSNAVALADRNGRLLAFVADRHQHVLRILDVASRQEIAVIDLAGKPSEVLVAKDGRVLVTLRDVSAVQVFTAKDNSLSLDARCIVATSAQPISLSESADHGKFLVRSNSGDAVDVLRGSDMTPTVTPVASPAPASESCADCGETLSP